VSAEASSISCESIYDNLVMVIYTLGMTSRVPLMTEAMSMAPADKTITTFLYLPATIPPGAELQCTSRADLHQQLYFGEGRPGQCF
jgi:hypothetical protein